MDDNGIIELYWARSEDAIPSTAAKYGKYLGGISFNILGVYEDAEECVSDTYLKAWNMMPPYRPSILSAFLAKITRRLSIDRWRKANAARRGGGEDPETGEGIRDFFIREGRRNPDEEIKYLIVVGNDIEDIRLQGYQNGACEPGEEVEGPAATLARRETTMGEVLKSIAQSLYAEISGAEFDGDHNRYLDERIGFDMYYGDIAKYFAEYGPMGTDPKERYSFEWGARLEDIVGETAYRDRIFYLAFPITIPAGGSMELTVEQYQPASFDFHCGGENVGIEGYDMVTGLGSNLNFLGQRAAIENYDAIEIVRQNFGFDLANGVTEVALEMGEPHYYLEVREIAGAEGE